MKRQIFFVILVTLGLLCFGSNSHAQCGRRGGTFVGQPGFGRVGIGSPFTRGVGRTSLSLAAARANAASLQAAQMQLALRQASQLQTAQVFALRQRQLLIARQQAILLQQQRLRATGNLNLNGGLR